MADSLEAKRSWVTLLYYYVAALIGLIIVIVGILIALHALLDVIFFEDPLEGLTSDSSTVTSGDTVQFAELPGPFSPSRGDKAKLILRGLVTAAVGAPVFWWHLREARRSERSPG